MNIKISVIIAAYNAEAYIDQCIRSFLDQSFRDFELIVVDDGSTDRTAEILAGYEAKDRETGAGRIRLIRNEHAGAAHARNTGFAAARGDYLLFFDADDFADPDLLQVMYEGCTGTFLSEGRKGPGSQYDETSVDEESHKDRDTIPGDVKDESGRGDNAFREGDTDRDKIPHAPAEICVVASRALNMVTGEVSDMGYFIKHDLLPEANPFCPLRDIPDNILLVFNGWAWDKLISRKVIERGNRELGKETDPAGSPGPEKKDTKDRSDENADGNSDIGNSNDDRSKREEDQLLEDGLLFQEIRSSNDTAFTETALVLAESVYVDSRPLVTHRQNDHHSLSNSREKSWNCFYLALLELKRRLEKVGAFEAVKKGFLRWCVDFIHWNITSLADIYSIYAYQLMREEGFKRLGILDADPAIFDGIYRKWYDFCMLVNRSDPGEMIGKLYDRFTGLEEEKRALCSERDMIQAQRDHLSKELEGLRQEMEELQKRFEASERECGRLREVEQRRDASLERIYQLSEDYEKSRIYRAAGKGLNLARKLARQPARKDPFQEIADEAEQCRKGSCNVDYTS